MTDRPPSTDPTGPAPALAGRVASGSVWIMASRMAGRVLDLAKALVLARLLSPSDFGLFGITMLALTTLETFSQTGMNAALIQRRGDIKPFLGTAWTIQIVRGFILAALLYVAAPAVSAFFREPAVLPLLRFVALVPVVQGFVSTGIVAFTRDLDFRRVFVLEVGSAIASLAAGAALAYQWRSPWALVWANLVGAAARLVLSFGLSGARPRLECRRPEAAELFAFGKWMSGYAVASWFWQNVDRLVLGRLIGPGPLGIYQMAQRVASMPVSEVAAASIGVALPAYVKIQGERDRLARSFLDTLEMTMSLVAPLAAFLVLAAPEVVSGLLGDRWIETVLPLQILSVGALLTALDVVATPLLVATGRPNVEFWKNAVRSAAVGAVVVPLTARFGLPGACVSFVLGSLVALGFWHQAIRAAGVTPRQLLRPAVVVAATAAPVWGAVVLARAVEPAQAEAALATVSLAAVAAWLAGGLALRAWANRGFLVHAIRLWRAWSSSPAPLSWDQPA